MWFNEYDEENNHAEDAVVPKLRVEPSLYEFDEPVARQFLDAFSQAFPFISKKLEKIQVEIPKIIEKDKRLIMQNECNHEFDSKLLKERMIILRRCTKCELEESLTWDQEKRKSALSNQS